MKWASKAESPPLVCQTAKGEGPGGWMGAGAGVVERGLKQRTMGTRFSMDKTRRSGESIWVTWFTLLTRTAELNLNFSCDQLGMIDSLTLACSPLYQPCH